MAADETSPEPSAAPTGPSAVAPATAATASVARERRDDPLTGLPLLRYRFTGPPTLRPGDPAPSAAWRVLRVDGHDGATTLDLETHTGAAPLAEHAAGIDDAVAAAALAALAEARALGVAHGDLGAHRLWRRGDRIWVEGYGVPWREGATVETDAHALAADLLAIAGTGLSAAMRERLAAVRDGGDPAAGAPNHASVHAPPPEPAPGPLPVATTAAPPPPDAATPPGAASPAADGTPTPAGPPSPDATTPPDAASPAADAAPAQVGPRLVRGPPPGATLRPGATGTWQRAVRDAAAAGRTGASALGVAAGAGAAPARRAAGGARLPSGVTRRHALMALALALGAGVWLGLASWSPPVPAAAIFVSRVVGHVVDVRVEPAGLPPVSLVVVESPAGSRLAPGTVVGSVPSKVLLDRDGVWRFQAQFGGTRSQIVVLVSPDEPVLVVPFPPPPPATAR